MSDLNVTNSSTVQNTVSTNTTNNQNDALIAKATALGIDVSEFYTSDGTLNTDLLNIAIQEASKQKVKNFDSNDDEFVKTTDGTEYTKEEANAEIKANKKTINTEFNNNSEYKIDTSSESTYEQEKLADEWESLTYEKYKLTSVTASNTTVIEGIKDFIKSLNNYISEAKIFNNNEDSDTENEDVTLSSIEGENIFAQNSQIKVFETAEEDNALGNNLFFTSAFKTSEYDEEEDEAIA